MPQEEAPRLSHVGLYVTDVPKMIDFYTSRKVAAQLEYTDQPHAPAPH